MDWLKNLFSQGGQAVQQAINPVEQSVAGFGQNLLRSLNQPQPVVQAQAPGLSLMNFNQPAPITPNMGHIVTPTWMNPQQPQPYQPVNIPASSNIPLIAPFGPSQASNSVSQAFDAIGRTPITAFLNPGGVQGNLKLGPTVNDVGKFFNYDPNNPNDPTGAGMAEAFNTLEHAGQVYGGQLLNRGQGALQAFGQTPVGAEVFGQAGKVQIPELPFQGIRTASTAEDLANMVPGKSQAKFINGGKPPLINESPSQSIGFKPPEIAAPPVEPPQPVIPPKKANPVDLFFNRTRNVIAQQGPAGQELAGRLQQARNIGETTAGNWVSQLPTVRKLSGPEFENFVDVSEGKAQPLNPTVAQAMQEWGGVRNDIQSTAQKAGLDTGKLENYFPHRYDPKMFEGDNFMKGVQHLVQTGQATTPQEAAQMMKFAQSDVINNRLQGNLEKGRFADLPGYEKTKDALFGYIEQAGKRIGQAVTLGKHDEIAYPLLEKIGQEGGDAAAAKEAYDIASGGKQYSQSSKQISGTLRKIQSFTKLGLGAITNTGQSVNTAITTGGLRTIFNIPKAFSGEAKGFALKSGVTLEGVLSDLKEGSGFTGKVMGKLTAPGFNGVEKFNRVLAAWSGKGYAEDLAKQAAGGSKSAADALGKMGLNVAEIVGRGGKLNEPEQIQAARNIVERTQFKVDPQDLPGWASSPYGKLFAQFKNFSYNQTAFVKREIYDEAKKGNFMPLIRTAVLGTAVGEGVGDAKASIRGRTRPTDIPGRALDNLNTVGGLGLVGDAYNAASRGPAGVASMLAGPAMGDVANWVGGAGLAVQKDKAGNFKTKTIFKQALTSIPIAGQTISNIAFPPKNAYKSRTPDLPVDQANAAESNPTPAPKASLTPLQKAQNQTKVSDINKQEKGIVGNTGTTLPIVGQIGGLTQDQQNAKLSQLDAQKKALQDQSKDPLTVARANTKQGLPLTPQEQSALTQSQAPAVNSANYTLQAGQDRRANDAKGFVSDVQARIDYLGQYEKSLNPQTDQAKILTTQSQIEGLTAQKDKVASQGYITKPKGVGGKSLLPRLPSLRLPIKSFKMKPIKTTGFSKSLVSHPAAAKLPHLKVNLSPFKTQSPHLKSAFHAPKHSHL